MRRSGAIRAQFAPQARSDVGNCRRKADGADEQPHARLLFGEHMRVGDLEFMGFICRFGGPMLIFRNTDYARIRSRMAVNGLSINARLQLSPLNLNSAPATMRQGLRQGLWSFRAPFPKHLPREADGAPIRPAIWRRCFLPIKINPSPTGSTAVHRHHRPRHVRRRVGRQKGDRRFVFVLARHAAERD